MFLDRFSPTGIHLFDVWERKLEQQLVNDSTVPETERLAIICARNGQGLFKERVGKIESRCRITGVENAVHLVASHRRPWRDYTNEERLNGENGLLLTPSVDHLFDRGFLGFEDSGKLLISPVAHRPSPRRMGIDTTKAVNVGGSPAAKSGFWTFTGTPCWSRRSAISMPFLPQAVVQMASRFHPRLATPHLSGLLYRADTPKLRRLNL